MAANVAVTELAIMNFESCVIVHTMQKQSDAYAGISEHTALRWPITDVNIENPAQSGT